MKKLFNGFLTAKIKKACPHQDMLLRDILKPVYCNTKVNTVAALCRVNAVSKIDRI